MSAVDVAGFAAGLDLAEVVSQVVGVVKAVEALREALDDSVLAVLREVETPTFADAPALVAITTSITNAVGAATGVVDERIGVVAGWATTLNTAISDASTLVTDAIDRLALDAVGWALPGELTDPSTVSVAAAGATRALLDLPEPVSVDGRLPTYDALVAAAGRLAALAQSADGGDGSAKAVAEVRACVVQVGEELRAAHGVARQAAEQISADDVGGADIGVVLFPYALVDTMTEALDHLTVLVGAASPPLEDLTGAVEQASARLRGSTSAARAMALRSLVAPGSDVQKGLDAALGTVEQAVCAAIGPIDEALTMVEAVVRAVGDGLVTVTEAVSVVRGQCKSASDALADLIIETRTWIESFAGALGAWTADLGHATTSLKDGLAKLSLDGVDVEGAAESLVGQIAEIRAQVEAFDPSTLSGWERAAVGVAVDAAQLFDVNGRLEREALDPFMGTLADLARTCGLDAARGLLGEIGDVDLDIDLVAPVGSFAEQLGDEVGGALTGVQTTLTELIGLLGSLQPEELLEMARSARGDLDKALAEGVPSADDLQELLDRADVDQLLGLSGSGWPADGWPSVAGGIGGALVTLARKAADDLLRLLDDVAPPGSPFADLASLVTPLVRAVPEAVVAGWFGASPVVKSGPGDVTVPFDVTAVFGVLDECLDRLTAAVPEAHQLTLGRSVALAITGSTSTARDDELDAFVADVVALSPWIHLGPALRLDRARRPGVARDDLTAEWELLDAELRRQLVSSTTTHDAARTAARTAVEGLRGTSAPRASTPGRDHVCAVAAASLARGDSFSQLVDALRPSAYARLRLAPKADLLRDEAARGAGELVSAVAGLRAAWVDAWSAANPFRGGGGDPGSAGILPDLSFTAVGERLDGLSARLTALADGGTGALGRLAEAIKGAGSAVTSLVGAVESAPTSLLGALEQSGAATTAGKVAAALLTIRAEIRTVTDALGRFEGRFDTEYARVRAEVRRLDAAIARLGITGSS